MEYNKELTAAEWKKIYKYKNIDGEIQITGYKDWHPEVVIPEYICGKKVTSIGARAFQGLSITDVVLPPSIISIEAEAFDKCKSLKNIELNEGLKTIGISAFNKCASIL